MIFHTSILGYSVIFYFIVVFIVVFYIKKIEKKNNVNKNSGNKDDFILNNLGTNNVKKRVKIEIISIIILLVFLPWFHKIFQEKNVDVKNRCIETTMGEIYGRNAKGTSFDAKYNVNGVTYKAEGLNSISTLFDLGLRSLHLGDSVVVHYNPNNVSEAYILEPNYADDFLTIVIEVVVLIDGLILFSTVLIGVCFKLKSE